MIQLLYGKYFESKHPHPTITAIPVDDQPVRTLYKTEYQDIRTSMYKSLFFHN